ncbi:polyprenyl synthetase family protein [Candidatus Hecatella orcuttiae]|uniref:polyprenyl synthetase family protein n=1 Tax=Candidatus Hecatella orcuttiae TaxID=1935119 RepID=UPI0028682C99|nr:polyprenyl synthetase family protein [Candidatus Hecatella orcuttiae]
MASNSSLPWPDDLGEVSRKVGKIIAEMLTVEKPELQLLYQAARHLPSAGGKMLRPYLAVKTCELVGGNAENALPVAAAVELLHTFTLIHDDIIDRDPVRRGVASVHARWGEPVGIIAGDLLFAKVYEAVLEKAGKGGIPESRALKVFALLTEAAIQLCEGQMLDMTYPKVEEVTEEQYFMMVEKKTAYLFKTAAQAGAIVGGGSQSQVERLGSFARLAGLAFQIVDDVLGLTASEEKLGKPVGSDLREGKKTLPIIHALHHAQLEQRALFLQVMQGTPAEADLLKARELIVSLGSTSYAQRKAEELVREALDELEGFPPTKARADLAALTGLLVRREF